MAFPEPMRASRIVSDSCFALGFNQSSRTPAGPLSNVITYAVSQSCLAPGPPHLHAGSQLV